MRIMLVFPPARDYTNYWFPHLGLGSLAGVLRRAGHEVSVVDCVAGRVGPGAFSARLRESRPALVGVTATTCDVPFAGRVAALAKAVEPRVYTVLGGCHVSAVPRATLAALPAFDAAVLGEGESALLEVAARVEEGQRDLSGIPGVAWRDARGEIRLGPPPRRLDDLDALPLPAWEAFDLRRGYHGMMGLRRGLELCLMMARGCPFNCAFCQRFLGRQVRWRDPERVLEEMERDLSLGARSLLFCDETFTLDRRRTLAVCEGMLRRGLERRLFWACSTRVDTVDPELLRVMARSRCVRIDFGVESGSPRLLEAMGKGITLDQVEQAFAWARAAGIRTLMTLVIGFPYEDEDSLRATERVIFRVRPDYIAIGILVPYPGTEVLEMARRGEGGLRLRSGDWFDYEKQMGHAITIEQLPEGGLQRWQSRTYARFYLRPSRVYRLLELSTLRGLLRMAAARLLGRRPPGPWHDLKTPIPAYDPDAARAAALGEAGEGRARSA